MKGKSVSNKRLYRNMVVAFVPICVAIGFACCLYYFKLQETVKTESGAYLQEISKQMGSNVSQTNGGNFDVFDTVVTAPKGPTVSTFSKLGQLFATHRGHSGCENAPLVRSKEPSMSVPQVIDSEGYAHIINKDGIVAVPSGSMNALEREQFNVTLASHHQYMTYMPLVGLDRSPITFVPVAAVMERPDILFSIVILSGAFIIAAFTILLVFLFRTVLRNKRSLEHTTYVDTITGGNTISRFYELAAVHLASAAGGRYALILSNIQKFMVLNEQFGREVCDDVLKTMHHGIQNDLGGNECLGRLFADNFCILVEYKSEGDLAERFARWQQNSEDYVKSEKMTQVSLVAEFGIFVITEENLSIVHMIDRAKLALGDERKEFRGKVHYSIYDEHLRKSLFREKQLEERMEDALKNREFEVYLQPKYHTDTEIIGGAEALVRWNSKIEGMIYPDEFIPLFEKNGFVIQLDLFVFEETCRTIRGWIDAGKPTVRISVNCSRIHLKDVNFLDSYIKIAKKYNMPKYAMELELTETTVFENVEDLSQIIREVREAGFGCSTDDFGSGYSSLNIIQDIPVDTIKLDKIFFRTADRDIKRTESVVGSIIAMSKALNMKTVAEGVEERPHVDMLKRLKCDYIQGYYFAKPMKISEFEGLAFTDTMKGAAGLSVIS